MNIHIGQDNVAYVTLSKRNLDDLVREFERIGHAGLRREVETGELLYVVVENDEKHYGPAGQPGSRTPGPGMGR